MKRTVKLMIGLGGGSTTALRARRNLASGLLALSWLVTGACYRFEDIAGDGYAGPTAPTRATETQLRGTVIDAATSAPIAGATVAIGTTSWVTGADGTYTLQHLTALAADLETVRAGYDTARTFLALNGGDQLFNVRMRASAP